jgi:GDP-L-fucose synthase
VVIVGTVCSHPKCAAVPSNDEDLCNGYPEEMNAPYGVAKKMLLMQTRACHDEYGFESMFVIPTTVYRRGDTVDCNTSHVIPAIIRRCVEAQETGADKVVLRESGRPDRESPYVAAAAEGIVLVLKLLDDREPTRAGAC